MLRKLGISRSGYNAWKNRKPSESEKRRAALKVEIREIYNDSYQNYGAPKISKILRKRGHKVSQRTVGNYMRQMGIRAQWVRPWTVTTVNSDFSKDLKNILNRDFNPKRPNAIWCSDITYIWTADGFVYLTTIMDLFSRKIIAWSLSETLEVSCVIEAINLAKSRRNTDLPLVIHQDRGSQYVSKEFKKATSKMQRSYSKKGDPYDNACVESFFALIKREWLNRFKIINYNHAKSLVFKYIETFYNTKRIHSHCSNISPNDYEKLYYQKQNQKLKWAI